LEQEKAEVDEDLSKKLAEIEEMHKELDEKSKQIDALLLQLNESTRF
jgi:peptidoglycan hydrolase CwlO-like protein